MTEPNWKDSRHPLAIRYNELGNRLQDVVIMHEEVIKEAKRQQDPMIIHVFAPEADIDRMCAEMRSIESKFEQETEWADHWLT